jgi:hypothetical protein
MTTPSRLAKTFPAASAVRSDREPRHDFAPLLENDLGRGRREADPGELGRGDRREVGRADPREVGEEPVDEGPRSQILHRLLEPPPARRVADGNDPVRATGHGDARDVGRRHVEEASGAVLVVGLRQLGDGGELHRAEPPPLGGGRRVCARDRLAEENGPGGAVLHLQRHFRLRCVEAVLLRIELRPRLSEEVEPRQVGDEPVRRRRVGGPALRSLEEPSPVLAGQRHGLLARALEREARDLLRVEVEEPPARLRPFPDVG